MFKIIELIQWCDGTVANGEESKVASLLSSLQLQGVAPLNTAQPNQVAFFFSKHYQNDLMSTKAGVIVTGKAFIEPLKQALPQWKSAVIIACADPYLGMAKVLAEVSKFYSSHDHQLSERSAEIHPTAVIDPSAKISENVVIYPFCYVGKDCVVGKGTVLFPRVTLYERTRIGERCRIHAGVVIGSDGFGYAPKFDSQTKLPTSHQKIFHVGGVVIGNDVEIGANTTIDRGTIGDTVIGNQVKLDNLVQIAHNCNIGEGSIFCGAAAMAGSSSSGKFVYVGGHSGAGNQIHIGDYSKLSAYTGLGKDSEPHSEMGGIPARPLSEHYRILALQQKLLRERGKKK